jgi:multidrug efflux system outer membrane protein
MTNDESNPNGKMTHVRNGAGGGRFGRSGIRHSNLIRHSSFVIRHFSALLCLALGSCKVGTDYERPHFEVPGAYKSPASTQPASVKSLPGNWWIAFGDPNLTALEEAGTRYNPGLQAAMQRVIEAREAAKAVKSQFYPVVTANPSITRGRSTGSGHGGAGFGNTTTNVQVPFDLSYEVDIWGRVRRAYESQKALAQASAADYFVVMQTLQSDLAQDYFNLRSFDAQERIIDQNVVLYRQQLDLTKRQQAAGLAADTDVLQVQVLLDTTEAQEDDLRRQRADEEHAIAILTGRPPSALSLPDNPLTQGPPVIPAGLPIDLLKRRPDVAEAEQNLISANANVGVAQANYLPKLTLTGEAGFESFDLRDIVDWESRIFSFGPSLAFPIFNGGQLDAQLRQARATYLEDLANYHTAVLAAFGDVENSLSDLHFYALEADADRRAVEHAKAYRDASEKLQQQNVGIISGLQLIDADRTLLTNQLTEQQVLNQRLVSTVLLIKALGGGWEAPAATTQPAHGLTNLPDHSPSTRPTAYPGPLPAIPIVTPVVPPATEPLPQPTTSPASPASP